MRNKTLASLLILCGSTAAIANIATAPQDPMANNTHGNHAENTVANNTAMPEEPTNTGDDAPPNQL